MSLLAVTSGDIASGVVEAEGVDFDGVNDYLSRSTDLVGNVVSNTFTFSCLAYKTTATNEMVYYVGPNFRFQVYFSVTGFIIAGKNSSNTTIFNAIVTNDIPYNTFINIIVSIDLKNTSNRSIYINDKLATVYWSTYTNDFIDFTNETHNVVSYDNGTGWFFKGRLSNLFLDYTYRDLSIESNRRLFITADGKPTPTATLKALNPILYLPMKDAATAHINEGTGGNFVQNGTLDTASRGANQDNCKASYFDGVADYLSRTSLTGVADGKQFTLSVIYKISSSANLFLFGDDSWVKITTTNINQLFFQIYGADSTPALAGISTNSVGGYGSTITFTCSIDMSSGVNSRVLVNNVVVPITWSTFINKNLKFSALNALSKVSGVSPYGSTNLGELYFDTRYTDLSTSNPFWDSVAKRPKPVRQVIRETGVTPLIAMPLDASNAGKNYGTGGDFTVNSGPYVGARGGSEFWARSANFPSTTGNYLLKTGLLGSVIDSNKLTFCLYCKANTLSATNYIIKCEESTNTPLSVVKLVDGTISIELRNSSDVVVLSARTTVVASAGTPLIIEACIDLANPSNRFVYINGFLDSVTWTTYINDTVLFSSIDKVSIGANTLGNTMFNGLLSIMYFTTDYIDFSQETNRNKFIDQLGYPKDLKAQIEAGIIPKPLLYLPFDDPTNLGKNLGTGGNFTTVGTVTQGADVLG